MPFKFEKGKKVFTGTVKRSFIALQYWEKKEIVSEKAKRSKLYKNDL